MTEHPILFAGAMVRAILEGRKTQSRRVVKPQPKLHSGQEEVVSAAWEAGFIDVKCPYGKPGDRLWVRETFSAYAPSGQIGNWKTGKNVTYVYRAASENADVARWYPSIFLPRIASRITLEITNIRVERLQEISSADIQAEGILPKDYPNGTYISEFDWERRLWAEGWNALSAKRGYSWESNPFVWVIEFKKV
jgi:hypothetical protein